MTGHPEQDLERLAAQVSQADIIRVLLVEDDQDCRETLVDELWERGFVVRSFANGASLLGSLDTAADADIIILDWKLPKTPGIDLMARLRRHGVNLPIVFLTDEALAAHETLALDRGAIDFIDKARGVEVLVRRLRRVVETKPAGGMPADNRIVRGKLILRPNDHRANWNGSDVGLTVGEYRIVHHLASNAGRSLTYRAIYARLHDEGFVTGSRDGGGANVRSAIRRIRSKFRDCDPSFDEIQNDVAFGYRWGRAAGAGA